MDPLEYNFKPAPLDIPPKTFLSPKYFVLPCGFVFIDKEIPGRFCSELPTFRESTVFPRSYFVDLHNKVSSFGKYNYAGARIPLEHSNINVDKFRLLLPMSFEDIAILQYMEFGFPIGLNEDFILQPVLKNHSSSYDYFSHIDKFIIKELKENGIAGPFDNSPFNNIMISPLMTAVKKPNSRRAVFDASFGDYSLNLNTPEKNYLGENYEFSFPKLDDFADIILKLGKGCYLWKRDLSRFFLQLPLDPGDYDKVGCIWRGQLYLFTSYVWGCRHAGLNGQCVTTAVSTIHRSLGTSSTCLHKSDGCSHNCCHVTSPSSSDFNTLNYSDDFAGAELVLSRADLSYDLMGWLLHELGLVESLPKAESPRQIMKYLGILFDSLKMEMRVDDEKCAELKLELKNWLNKTVATKSEMQSILGKLMWIAKAVRFSRCFVLRIIAETKSLSNQKQKTTLSQDIRKDFLWWNHYMAVFNGVELLVPSEVSLQVAGDACPAGMGSWNICVKEYFSCRFPSYLLHFPIHIKEFICVIISIKLWGPQWVGKRCQIFCDNDAVCDVISYQKPKDDTMQKFLREFLFLVCRYNFVPVISKIASKENDVADFISRNYDSVDAKNYFSKENIPPLNCLEIPDKMFEFEGNW